MQLSALIVLLLPLVTPLIGSSVAAILSQRHWPAWVNDGLAWFILLAFAGLDMWANGQFAGGWLAIIGDGIQVVTLLSSSWLVKLDPWLRWLSWLQVNAFDLIPLLEQAQPTKITAIGTRAYTPTGIAPTAPKIEGVPPRASATDTPNNK